MPKTAYILAALLFSILSYGQQITFYENVNYRANTLQQSLNTAGDSLQLKSKSDDILKVEIFNDDYSKSYDVYSNATSIDLNNLPIGSFVIQARVGKQWIIMYLEKQNEDNENARNLNSDATLVSSRKTIKDLDNQALMASSQRSKDTSQQGSDAVFYWVVSESNSSFGSSKTMRLEYKDGVDKLISKNKLELKSSVGKNNTLIIYEVYNKSKFMDQQFRNPTYYKTDEASKFLNATPLYASNSEAEDDF